MTVPGSMQTASSVMRGLSALSGPVRGRLATGFEPLDHTLGGGLRCGELTVVGGIPGVGKTVLTLQWARSMAEAGAAVVYACYQHDPASLLARLLLLEVGELVQGSPEASWEARRAVARVLSGEEGLPRAIAGSLLLKMAQARLESYGERLHLVRATFADTDLRALERLTTGLEGASALFVDHLHNVPDTGVDEAERTTRVASGLKQLALDHGVGVAVVAAGGSTALDARRIRLHQLRGASAVGHEADLVMMLNDKFRAVSRLHRVDDPVRADAFKNVLVVSIDKNRQGPAPVDLEFDKDFAHFRLDPRGRRLAERLVGELMPGD